MKRRYLVLIACAVFLGSIVVVWSFNRVTHRHGDHLSLRLQWIHQAQFAGFYVAREKGFYKDLNLDVDIDPGGSSFNVPTMVSTGQADVGVWVGDQVLKGYAHSGMPIRAIGVVFRKSLVCYMVRRDSRIFSPSDFRGKRVGIYPGFDSESIYVELLRQANVERSDVHEYPAAYSIVPFLAGQVDVWPSYVINEPLSAREHGQPVRCLTPDMFGVKYYSDTLIVRDDTLQSKRDVVVRFMKASERGWRYALSNPDEAVGIVLKYDPSLHRDHEKAMLAALAEYVNPTDPFFQMDPEVWRAMAAQFQTRGLIPDAENALHVADFDIAEEAHN
jgi:ABC-type nitrate/sulfonate/bicarbonate transport system substrate-binding protein